MCCEVTVASSTMSMLVRPNGSGHLTFKCPRCLDTVTQEVDAHVVRTLRGVYCPETVVPSRPGPPITEDDLIDFGRSVERGDDPWTELTATASSPPS